MKSTKEAIEREMVRLGGLKTLYPEAKDQLGQSVWLRAAAILNEGLTTLAEPQKPAP